MNSVTIAKGGTSQMEVTINKAKENTAFQFDLSLPTGITVKSVGLNGEYPETRITWNDDVDGKARFLSYDEENANLNDDTKVMITLEAAGNDVWYNLSGQRVCAPTKKGLYIRNGKKIVLK